MKAMVKKKVLFFINSQPGGSERITINIAEFLDSNKYDVIFYIIGQNLGLVKKILPVDFNCKIVKVKSFKDFLLLKLFKILWKEKPCFVFSSLMPINWRLCLVSSCFLRTKVIVRANNYLYTQSFIQKLRLYISYKFADNIIVQTEEMRLEHIKLLKLKQSKVIHLANPINKNFIDSKLDGIGNPFSEKNVNYTFVGRIHPVKGIDVLLRSFSEVVKKQKNAMLFVVGDCGGQFENYYKNLLSIVEKENLGNNVEFTGFSENPYQYMRYADCLVLPSRNEGLPNVIIESLYIGTPVAVTVSIPVIKRMVREGVDGYLANVEDIVGLAEAMLSSAALGRVASIYNPASKEEFVELFN